MASIASPSACRGTGSRRCGRKRIGGGRASFAVAGGRAFTIEQRQRNEVVAAYDVMTGKELWTNAWPERFSQWMGGGEGPRATPAWADGLVFALGAQGRAPLPRRRQWAGGLADEHPAGYRRRESEVGHGGLAAHRGGRGDRAARRTGRSIGRRLRSPDRQAVVDGARRQAGLRLADAGHAPRRPAIPGRQRRAVGGAEPRSARRAVGVPVDDRSRRHRGPADRHRRQPPLLFVGLRLRRGRGRVDEGRGPVRRPPGLAQHPHEEPQVELSAARWLHLRSRRRNPRVPRRHDGHAQVERRALRTRPDAPRRRPPRRHHRGRGARPRRR